MLREYQSAIVDESLSLIDAGKHPLIEMATGTGKTRTAAEIVNRLKWRRTLWGVHRRELATQAVAALEYVTGEAVGIEMAGERSHGERIVVASKDTIRGARLASLGAFDLIVTDETHHSTANSYRQIYDAFPNATRVGLSATPFRSDRESLWMYDAATAPYGILRAIGDAWLVPVSALRVKATSVDLSGVRSVLGDLSEHDLGLVMAQQRAVAEVIDGLLEHDQGEPAILYATDIATAELYLEGINTRLPGMPARLVTGTTSDDARRYAFRDFGFTYRILVNVGVATEGVDLPRASIIAIARPTKSRSLFLQMIGRGLRPLPGIDAAADRVAWIAASSKPRCLVLDFVGNTGRHTIQSVAAAIGGSPRAVAKIERESLTGEISVAEALKREAAAEARRSQARALAEPERLRGAVDGVARAHITAEVADLIGLYAEAEAQAPATPTQIAFLLENGIASSATISKAEAASKIAAYRNATGKATPKQVAFLARFRKDIQNPEALSKSAAKRLFMLTVQRWRSRK